MKLKVTREYFDRLEDKHIPEGEVIEREDARAEQLMAAGVAVAYVEEPEATEEPESVEEPEAKVNKSKKKQA